MAAKRTTPSTQSASVDEGASAGLEETINRNFALPIRQAEWLRLTAFEERTSQAQLVREAIDMLIQQRSRRNR